MLTLNLVCKGKSYELTGLLADAIFPIPLMSGMMDIILRITNPPKVY